MTPEHARAAQVLREAADLIEPAGRWTQGEDARSKSGRPIGPLARGAVCWCAGGAIDRVTSSESLDWVRAQITLRQFLNKSVADWNDDPARTQAEVVAALRAAADRLDPQPPEGR